MNAIFEKVILFLLKKREIKGIGSLEQTTISVPNILMLLVCEWKVRLP